jgi:hypothetical protein
MKFMRYGILVVISGLLVLSLSGCSGTVSSDDDGDQDYLLFGLAEINLDLQQDFLYLNFTADGGPVPGSFAVVDGDTMSFNASGIIQVSSPTVSWDYNTIVAVTVYDTANSFVRTATARMPSDVTITNFIPATRLWTGGTVRLEWTGSAGAFGYLVTCVPMTDGSIAKGWAELVQTGVTAATIPPDAFLEVTPSPTPDRVVDSFFTYVVAYDPTFERRPDAKYSSTTMLDSLSFPVSVSGEDISGIFGAVVVSQREALYVPAQTF